MLVSSRRSASRACRRRAARSRRRSGCRRGRSASRRRPRRPGWWWARRSCTVVGRGATTRPRRRSAPLDARYDCRDGARRCDAPRPTSAAMCSTYLRPRDPARRRCIEAGCVFLYQYDDPLSGRALHGLPAEGLRAPRSTSSSSAGRSAPAAASGPSSSRASRCEPLRSSRSSRPSRARAAASRCVNRRFFDWPDSGPDAVRAFDLRPDCGS